ncbi:MAG: hypothetical protein P8090_09510, partial [Gammaproteobacteria bacterium]
AFADAKECFQIRAHAEGQSPGPLFCTAHYAAQSASYRAALRADPIRHYFRQGAQQRTSPHWLFHEDYYLAGSGAVHCSAPASLPVINMEVTQ